MSLSQSPQQNINRLNTFQEIADAKTESKKIEGKLNVLYKAAEVIPGNNNVKKLKIGKVILYVSPWTVTIAKPGKRSLQFNNSEKCVTLYSLPAGTIPPRFTGSKAIYKDIPGNKRVGSAKVYTQKAKKLLKFLSIVGY